MPPDSPAAAPAQAAPDSRPAAPPPRGRLHLLLLRLLALVPRPIVAAALHSLVELGHLTNASPAVRTRQNMMRFLGPSLGEEEVLRLVPRSRRHQIHAVTLLLYQLITGRSARVRLDEQARKLIASCDGTRGCMVVAPHNGMAETCATWALHSQGKGYATVVRPMDNPALAWAAEHLRRERGAVRLFSTRDFPTREVVRHLAGGGILLASFDAAAHTKGGLALPLLGGRIDLTTYPLKLLRLTDSRMLWVQSNYLGGSRLEMSLLDITEEVAKDGHAALARRLEEDLLRHPEQYLWSRKMRTEPAEGAGSP